MSASKFRQLRVTAYTVCTAAGTGRAATLNALDGVQDAVVFQPGEASVATIRRVAALVVAPGLTAAQIQQHLAGSIDPAFIPRPLILVDALPRNELGKLPREALLSALTANR